MLKRISAAAAVLLFSLLVPILQSTSVHASINSCTASVNPNQLSPGVSDQLQFTVNNTDTASIRWVQITSPSANYTIDSGGADNWGQTSNNDSFVIFTSGSIQPSLSDVFRVNVSTVNAPQAAENWQVQVSDNPNGDAPFGCGGSLATSIVGQPLDTTPPSIYNVSVINLTNTSVKISWLTDEPATSQVGYGPDQNYGDSSNADNSLITNHNVTLSGLNAGTGYHFQVISTDGAGNTATSGDSTFLTVTPISQPAALSRGSAPVNIVITNPGDKTPPTITLSTTPPKVVKTIPTINGTASDDLAVVRIEYSTDGGQNWLPVDNAPSLGGKAVDFSFTPANLDDGNYTILARAIDAGGNITATPPTTVVIDRLQPVVGGSVLNLGPQILRSNDDGAINTTVGIDQKITLSAVGGPTSISLNAEPVNTQLKTKNLSKTFALTQSADTGLWQGILSFGDPGTYTITANAVDGAGNRTSRILAKAQVSGASKVIKKGTNQTVKNAKVTVYYLDSESNDWVVWDGGAYGQPNPQITDKTGGFNLFLPAGKYYLKTSAPGYQTLTSGAFTINNPSPISTTLAMAAGHSFWPSFSTQKISLNTPNTSENKQTNSLIGKQVPTFSLTDTRGDKVNSLDWLAKPTLISLNATWSPETIDQLKVLQRMQSNQNYNVISVGLEQTGSQLGVYNNLSGLNLNWLPDPDGSLASVFNAQGLPTNYFVDRTGVIRHVTSGILTEQQILDYLTN